jgi:hypothetical protein
LLLRKLELIHIVLKKGSLSGIYLRLALSLEKGLQKEHEMRTLRQDSIGVLDTYLFLQNLKQRNLLGTDLIHIK